MIGFDFTRGHAAAHCTHRPRVLAFVHAATEHHIVGSGRENNQREQIGEGDRGHPADERRHHPSRLLKKSPKKSLVFGLLA
jgi:hypothetical protein